jgi:DNA-binding LytR/AlgR family response regulator
VLYLPDQKYTILVTRLHRSLLNLSLKEVQHRLDPEVFWRIHRSTIVNVGAIDAIYGSFRASMEIRLRSPGTVCRSVPRTPTRTYLKTS